MPTMIGQIVSHYKILEKLGEGGMGVVYKAHDTNLDRDVALKFLPHHLTATADEQARFLQEARAASALNHPNICGIYSIGEEGENQFIEMEYVDGKTLRQMVPVQKTQIAIDYAIQIGEALQEAHSKGIVHRDVKADNIMVNSKNQIRVMDFGLAKLKGSLKLTKTSSTVGTLAYMAPEQIEGGEVDARCDIFSFGVVLHEMLTGHMPFRGEHEAAMMYSILNEQPEPLQKYRSDTPEELQRIIGRALEKDPEDRYQSAADMVSEIRRLRKKTSKVLREIPTPTPSAPTVSTTQPPAKSGFSKQTLLAIGAGAIVLIGLVLAFLVFRAGSSSDKKSIAVLPFKNMNTDEESEYFSDGITEDIINQLSKIRELRVMSRPAVMRYKKTDKTLREIGKELNVSTLLMGSVRRMGNQVRISAELIDASTEQQLWGEAYDKTMNQIFEIQGAVARQIATMLQANLTAEEKRSVEKPQTDNVQAYTFYLKGREYYYRYHKEDNENAIILFKKALELDPSYALAYAGLGDAYGQRVQRFSYPSKWLDSAATEGQKSVALDANLAEGYKALGLAYHLMGKNSLALVNYQKSAALNPSYFPALLNVGYTLQSMGKPDEAIPWMKKALSTNPTFPVGLSMLGGLYMDLDEFTKAREYENRSLELEPDLLQAHQVLCYLDVAEGKLDQAKGRCQKFLSSMPNEPAVLLLAGNYYLWVRDFKAAAPYFERELAMEAVESKPYNEVACIYLKLGRTTEAQKLLRQNIDIQKTWIAKGDESARTRLSLATSHVLQGDKAEAYKGLHEAAEKGFLDYQYASGSPLFDNVRNDEEFNEIIASLKSKVTQMRKHAEELERE
jgi:serine/threonine protein kinase/Tfp pilus assembly protein PilF